MIRNSFRNLTKNYCFDTFIFTYRSEACLKILITISRRIIYNLPAIVPKNKPNKKGNIQLRNVVTKRRWILIYCYLYNDIFKSSFHI